MDYIKSPLNYTGGKYKLLPQILPLFPKDIHTFVDLFGGGFNVGINVEAKRIVYNDILREVVEMIYVFKQMPINELLNEIDGIIEDYKLDKYNKEGYLSLREHYNRRSQKLNYEGSFELYTLICHSFSNQIRFNKKGEFNMPFGSGRSSFNPSLRKRFIQFIEKLQEKSVTFLDHDFKDLVFPKDSFVYCDPPYLNSIATYNESDGWNCDKELELLEYLDDLHKDGIKFALSNNLKYDNPILKQWIEDNKDKYKVHYLNADYNNCNYQKKNKEKDIEVLITNY